MPGPFDDLIPKQGQRQKATSGPFDDLIPQAPQFNFPLDDAVREQAPSLPGPSALAGAGGEAAPDESISGIIKGISSAEQERFISARQRTSEEVRDSEGNFLRPVLGEAKLNESLEIEFDTPDGPVRADKNQHVVLRDPQTGKQMVFSRTPETDQGALLSGGQIAATGLLTGPLTGAARAPRLITLGDRTVRLPGTQASEGASRFSLSGQRAQEAARDLQAFEETGTRPFGPAFGTGPIAATARQTAELPGVGAQTRTALEESLSGTAEAARGAAGRLGTTSQVDDAAQVVRGGIERFKDARPAEIVDDVASVATDAQLSATIRAPANATSLKTKQAALYERAWRLIPESMRGGRAVRGQTRVLGGLNKTRELLGGIRERNLGMINRARAGREGGQIARPVQGGLLGRIMDDILEGSARFTLQDMRNIRSSVRRLASGMADTERNTLSLSDLQRLQTSVTQDMVDLLQRNAAAARAAGRVGEARNFERAVKEFRRADQFTAGSFNRLEKIQKLFNANDVESLGQAIKRAALGGTKNIEILRTLRRTLRPQEMDEVRATFVHEMGRPTAGAKGLSQALGFSVSEFATNYRKLTPQARAILFPGEHGRAIENIFRQSNRLAEVEALANKSRSFSNAVGVSTIIGVGGAGVAGGLPALAGGAAATAGASFLFSRPQYAKWALGWARLRARPPSPQVNGQLVAHANRLAQLARQDEALLPVFNAVADELGIEQGPNNEPGQQEPIRFQQAN